MGKAIIPLRRVAPVVTRINISSEAERVDLLAGPRKATVHTFFELIPVFGVCLSCVLSVLLLDDVLLVELIFGVAEEGGECRVGQQHVA